MLLYDAMIAQCDCSGGFDAAPLVGAMVFLVMLRLAQSAATKGRGVNLMKSSAKVVIVIALCVVVSAVLVFKVTGKQQKPAAQVQAEHTERDGLPRLLDLGSGHCIPCKMMMPVLEELQRDFAGRLKVEYIDLSENPEMGQKYNVRAIPTQIFISPDGKELYRHEGYFPREAILAKWKELGYDLAAPTSADPGGSK